MSIMNWLKCQFSSRAKALSPKATDDLNMVLAMATTPTDVKTEARRELERMKRQSSQSALWQLPDTRTAEPMQSNPTEHSDVSSWLLRKGVL